MESSSVVLLFAEDPGAANFIAPLIPALRALGYQPEVIATGTAAGVLTQRRIDFEHLSRDETESGILGRLKPHLFVAGTASNPDTRGLPLIDAARKGGIPTVGVVDAAMNADHRFRGRGGHALAYAPDWILVPDENIRKSFIQIGMAPAHVLALGHPHYDYVTSLADTWRKQPRDRFQAGVFPSLPPTRPILLFASEGSRRTLSANGLGSGRTETALEKLLAAIAGLRQRPLIVLRAHPKDRLEDFAPYRDQLDLITAAGSALEMAYASDLVIGTTSMLMTEATLLGKATLAILETPGEADWLPGIRAHVTPVAYHPELLAPEIDAILAAGAAPAPPAGWVKLGGTRDTARFISNLPHQNQI